MSRAAADRLVVALRWLAGLEWLVQVEARHPVVLSGLPGRASRRQAAPPCPSPGMRGRK